MKTGMDFIKINMT